MEPLVLQGKKVLLLGLGLHGGGVSTARWLSKKGARVVVSDQKTRHELTSSLARLRACYGLSFVLGRHRKKDVAWADYVVVNPGVPADSEYVRYARSLGKPIYNEASLFFNRCRAYTIAVTGTRGKSTTAAYIAAMCEKKGKRVFLAGNIRTSFMLNVVDRARAEDVVVLELSSWQLEGLGIVQGAPDIAVVTNVMPDHLNRYRSLAHYYCSKKEIFKYQQKKQILILNAADKIVRSWQKEACAKIYLFATSNHRGSGAYAQRGRIFFSDQHALMRQKPELVADLRAFEGLGEHNVRNALAAVTAAKAFGADSRVIRRVLKHPPQLPGRQQILGVWRGITIVNDTTSTTPEAGMAALARFRKPKKKIILIAGGADKKLLYRAWGRAVARTCKSVYLLSGDASKKQRQSLGSYKNISVGHNDLDAAVKLALQDAVRGDVLLFSPAAASFNLFVHEFARGAVFEKAMRRHTDMRERS